jgi:putative restriction endonuclease
LTGDTLHWQGQASGKSDLMIIEHNLRGLELLVFYRDEPKQYADSGFRYLGQVEYVTHKGDIQQVSRFASKRSFTLQRL